MLLEAQTGIIIGVAIIIAIAIAGIIVLLCTKKSKNKIVVDETLINNMIAFLGGKENIKDYSKENARVKFLVNSVESVDLESLKTISEKGIFITGNNVKTLFKYDSDLIIKMLDKILK